MNVERKPLELKVAGSVNTIIFEDRVFICNHWREIIDLADEYNGAIHHNRVIFFPTDKVMHEFATKVNLL